MFEITLTGRLGHDNNYFDRTCQEHGGMYASYQTAICPKCNIPLSLITTGKGKAMGISEGTIYPIQREEYKKNDEEAVAKRKNGMRPLYRFVLFSFADDQGNLAPPGVHPYLRKGKEILIKTQHQPVPSWFKTREGEIRVELRIMVFPHMGDKLELLGSKESGRINDVAAPPAHIPAKPEAPPATTAQPQMDMAMLFQMKQKLDALFADPNAKAMAAGATSEPVQEEIPFEEEVDAFDSSVIPDDDIPF